jgi:hypothetical protein
MPGCHSICLFSRAISGMPLWIDPPHEGQIMVEKRPALISKLCKFLTKGSVEPAVR